MLKLVPVKISSFKVHKGKEGGWLLVGVVVQWQEYWDGDSWRLCLSIKPLYSHFKGLWVVMARLGIISPQTGLPAVITPKIHLLISNLHRYTW